jgi:hypothetical protein
METISQSSGEIAVGDRHPKNGPNQIRRGHPDIGVDPPSKTMNIKTTTPSATTIQLSLCFYYFSICHLGTKQTAW